MTGLHTASVCAGLLLVAAAIWGAVRVGWAIGVRYWTRKG